MGMLPGIFNVHQSMLLYCKHGMQRVWTQHRLHMRQACYVSFLICGVFACRFSYTELADGPVKLRRSTWCRTWNWNWNWLPFFFFFFFFPLPKPCSCKPYYHIPSRYNTISPQVNAVEGFACPS
ncbi:hypothetical protein M441DRAFT_367040 [Trichoderma asperellum CBS 433.97]|uniref:Uncharacterized protein n=1 Tax=Trichoderma asperellum (strain ATCC 204424 / CBS 433.97 / NBRC 101777) TaxID=1042311 RepID=A0A2T3ZEE2_TRIA4|nr:hypothetical protein M441DRAFT_367040 [Trichoderma asperellum CBS 433.97]PTB43182.1 hypothetical protein M441DRAFT_367040 [Trichoderma asperellum CBS 433.97]